MDDKAIEEIRKNLQPEDVFTDDQLIKWARRCHSADEVFPLKDLKAGVDEAKSEWKM